MNVLLKPVLLSQRKPSVLNAVTFLSQSAVTKNAVATRADEGEIDVHAK